MTSPPEADRTIPWPLRAPPPPLALGDSIGVAEGMVRFYLVLGALTMMVGAGLIGAQAQALPVARLVAAAYGVVGLLAGALLLAPPAWQRRWNLRALGLLVALAVVAAGFGAQARGFGLATPSLLFLPLLVFAMTALMGWRPGLALALWVALVMAVAQATTVQRPSAVPLAVLGAALAVALAVAVATGAALNQRIRLALRTAERREQRFHRLLSLAADVYWEVDEAQQLVTAGQPHDAESLQPSRRHAGQPWHALPSLQLEPAVRALMDEATRARRPFRDLPVAWLHRDGQRRTYLVSGEPRLEPGGPLRGYWGVARDITAIEATRAALADSQARYEALFHQAPLPLLLLQPSGRVVAANPAAAVLLRQDSAASLPGLDLQDLYASESERERARGRLRMLQTLPPGTRLPLTEQTMHIGGRDVVIHATAVRIELQGEQRVLSMFVDITERKRAEEALRRSETTLAHLVDTSPDLITLSELASGRYRMVNRAYERVTGWTQAEALGRTALELGVWPSADARAEFVAALRRAGSLREHPIHFRRRDGSLVLLLVAAVVMQVEGQEHLVITGRDITGSERERLERAAILDNAGIGIAVTRDSAFVLANAEFERMMGWPAGQLLGQPGRVVWPSDEDYAEVGRAVGPLLGQGLRVELERQVQRHDGSRFLAKLRAGAIDQRQPASGGTVWIVEDITERRQFERALAQARDAAEAASRAKSAFLANTSHELRTPLNGLLGLASLAREPGLAAPLREQYLGQIEDSAQMLAAIISDILDLSKIEAGRLVIETAPFDLQALLESVLRTHQPVAQQRGLVLALELEPGLPMRVLGDALRVRQIVGNFVANAVKFTQQGFVRLSLQRAAARPGAGQVLRIACTDSGPGIAPEVLPLLFKPFTQADQSTTRRYGGTGLGLSICRELAELLGGRVGVDSALGQGSCFWAELPLPATEAPLPSHPLAHPDGDDGADLAGLRVLMVEDNDVNMLIAVAMLERWGVQVTQAGSGHAALAAVDSATAPFDLVLMDVQMPDMSGHEVTRALRQRPAALGLPIVALTAAALVGERDEALAAGMDDFLTKPIDRDRLLAALQRWRHGRQARSTPRRAGPQGASEAPDPQAAP